MKKRYLLIGLLALVVALALAAVACGDAGEDTPGDVDTTEGVTTTVTYPVGSSTGPIKVGHIIDITGNEAFVGTLFQQGAAAVLTGAEVGGRPIELIEADSKSTSEGAVEAARKLVEQDNVDVIMGPTQTGQKTAVAAYCAEQEVPMILYNPTPPDAVANNDWVIALGGVNAQYGTVIADYMYNELGYMTISTMGADDSGGRAFFAPVIEHFEALGGQVIQSQWTLGQTDDWSAYMTNVDTSADALCAWIGGSGIGCLTAYYNTGLYEKIPMVAAFHGGFTDPFVPKGMAEAGDTAAAMNTIGIPSVSAWNPDNMSDASVEFNAAYAAIGPWASVTDAGPTGAGQASELVLAALESCYDNLSHLALRDAILAVDFEGPEGRAYFAPGENIATRSMYIVAVAHDDEGTAADPKGRDIFKYVLLKTYDDVPPEGLQ